VSGGDFLKRFEKAFGMVWKSPPGDAARKAQTPPPGDPVPPPSARSPVERIEPADVRSAATEEETGAMITRSLPGLDVTLLVTAPEGDALWSVQGRAWRKAAGGGSVRVVLVQDDHVLGEATVDDGGSFAFEDLLAGDWGLEFHLGGDEIVVLRGPSP
jgi:hypothetical protein